MSKKAGEPKASRDDEDERETRTREKPDGDRLTRARPVLELITSLTAMVMTVGSALVKLFVERRPTLEPIGVVLVAFFAFLSLSALLQLFLFWRDLATPAARVEFLRTMAFGFFLFGVMVGGMLARYLWELFQAGRTLAEADPTVLVLPLVVSLTVFYPLWTVVSGSTKNLFAIVAAFQNGFFWQTLFSGLRPFAGAAS